MRMFFLVSFLTLLCLGEVSRADKPATPSTYKKASPNGEFVFVMIAPESLEMELKRYNEKHQKVVKAIRDVYSKSGLYKNNGAKEPVWTVDWYAFSVQVASDGIHLVRQGHWPVLEEQFKGENRSITKNDLKQEAISVFANGKILRQYTIGELVDEPKLLPISVSHFQWMKQWQILDGKNQLEIITHDQNRIVVDLPTAKIVEKKKSAE